jgi:hypothetical protein
MNKTSLLKFVTILGLLGGASLAQAAMIDSISTSASGTGDGTFTSDMYGYTFTIDQHDALTFHATLTNTSDPLSSPEALIDAFAFNIDSSVVLGTDFTIENILPAEWTITAATGGVKFDYVGTDPTTGTPNRLGVGDSLTFDFLFTSAIVDPLTLWTGADSSCGSGFGGGNDCGQVAVSFQQLGAGGNSDLLASNWTREPHNDIPEPGTALLLGLGLIGLSRMKKATR